MNYRNMHIFKVWTHFFHEAFYMCRGVHPCGASGYSAAMQSLSSEMWPMALELLALMEPDRSSTRGWGWSW